MQSILSAALFLVLVSGSALADQPVCGPATPAPASKASAQETFAWVQTQLEASGKTTGYYESSGAFLEILLDQHVAAVTSDPTGCTWTFTNDKNEKKYGDETHEVFEYLTNDKVDFSKLDLELSLNPSGQGAYDDHLRGIDLMMKVRGGESLIQESDSDTTSQDGQPTKTSAESNKTATEVDLVLPNCELAQRFMNAIAHIDQLCGSPAPQPF